MRRTLLAVALLASTLQAGAAARRPVLLTGEVQALDSQPLVIPPSNSSPIVLRNFVVEGSSVKAGDVVLRIETGGAANIDRLMLDLEQIRSRAERDAAKLEAGAIDAEKALVTARAALAKAKVDAALPKAQIAALNYDRNQNELDRSLRDLEVRQSAYANAREAVARRLADGDLEVKKLQINIAYQSAQLAQSEVRAENDGVVIHGYNQWRNERFEEGSSGFPGNLAGRVLGAGELSVLAWVLEADRSFLSEGQAMQLQFDALPGATLTGKITTITSAPEARASWGQGRYFRVSIGLPAGHGLALAPGMSVFAEPLAGAAKIRASANAAAVLAIEGEVASRQSTPIAPPAIPYIWQYKLAKLAPEGMMVAAGDTVALFESMEVTTRLAEAQSSLRERQRALDKFKLDEAEADRAGDLAVSETQSNTEKADRKAEQPRELIRRTDYDKLVIERGLNRELALLSVSLRNAQRRARKAEKAGLEGEVAKLVASIAALSKGRTALNVVAPKAGLVLYRTNFNGEKFSTGSQIWVGLSVATLADPGQLYINAKVPEAQASKVHVGQSARVTVPGANQALNAHVTALGRAFHGKSTMQSLVVRDVELQFDQPPQGLKPGAAVQAVLAGDAPAKERAK